MIDIISAVDLRRLAEAAGEYCVSIFLPTHPAGGETAQDPIRLKNLLARVGVELESLGMRAPEAAELLSAASALHGDGQFWAHVEQGLAVFITEEATWTYRLPNPVDELVVVADRFHVKPLLPSVATGEAFYVLALSQNEVRLLGASRFRVSELALGEIPESLTEALWFDDRESQLQYHGADRVGSGRVTATFHGHGVGKDTNRTDLDRFLAAVDAGVCQLVGHASVPLVLAGVDDVVSRYRRLSKYPHVVEGGIGGNPELLSAVELHERAWPLVETLFAAAQRRARETVEGGSVPTVDTLPEAVIAATSGRIESLFVPVGVQQWGSFDAERGLVDEHQEREPGDRDLLDAAAIETLVHGGSVFAVAEADVPRGGPVAAVLRF